MEKGFSDVLSVLYKAKALMKSIFSPVKITDIQYLSQEKQVKWDIYTEINPFIFKLIVQM